MVRNLLALCVFAFCFSRWVNCWRNWIGTADGCMKKRCRSVQVYCCWQSESSPAVWVVVWIHIASLLRQNHGRGHKLGRDRHCYVFLLFAVCQEGRAALWVLNKNKESVLLHCFPPGPSHVVFLADVASLLDLFVPQPL